MKGKWFFIVGLMALFLAIGVTLAGAQPEDTTFYGCLNESDGTIRVFLQPTQCEMDEVAVTWNKMGTEAERGNLALAGQTCDEGEVMYGFDGNGDILCSYIGASKPVDYKDFESPANTHLEGDE